MLVSQFPDCVLGKNVTDTIYVHVFLTVSEQNLASELQSGRNPPVCVRV